MVALRTREVIVPMIQRGKPPSGYLTASATRRMLGNISDGMLRTYINKGLIERFVPPGRTQGFYRREDVEKLAREIEFTAWQADARASRSSFRPATAEDIEAIADIDERTFNARGTNPEPRKLYFQQGVETYARWLARNPQTFFVLENTAGKILGFACLLPMKWEAMERFIRDEVKWTDIADSDIDLFEPGNPLHLYVIALCIDPVYPRKQRRTYGARLLSGVFEFFLELARRGVEIATITGRNEPNHPDGKRLMQDLGMPLLRSPVSHMLLFSVRLAESGYPKFMKYTEILEQWKREHQQEQ